MAAVTASQNYSKLRSTEGPGGIAEPQAESLCHNNPVAERVNDLVHDKANSKFYDFCLGAGNSKFLRGIILTTAAIVSAIYTQAELTKLATLSTAFYSTIPGPTFWIMLVIKVAVFATVAFFQFRKNGAQKIAFEFTAFGRMFKKSNFDEIAFERGDGKCSPLGRVFLGALPNRLVNDGKKLQKAGVTAVLSINEEWERQPMGLSLPYCQASWREVGVRAYHPIDARDHQLMAIDDLHAAADFIHEHMDKGENVYVHCRAGVGRSGMAVAAYLIKYQKMSIPTVQRVIKDSRKKATIYRKTEGLEAFQASLNREIR